MEKNYSISKATPEIISEATTLINSAYHGENGSWTSESHLVSGDRLSEADLARLMRQPGTECFVCSIDNKQVVGFVSLETKEDLVYLGLLSVSPQLQAGGIGRRLLAFGEQYAKEKGLPAICITVINIRPELIAWYERRGYTKTGKTIPFPVPARPKMPLELMEMKKIL